MKFRSALVAAVVVAATVVTASDAEARRGWRRGRAAPRVTSSYSPRSYNSNSALQAWRQAGRRNNPVTYSGVSRAEQDSINRTEAWFEYTTGGFRLVDFL